MNRLRAAARWPGSCAFVLMVLALAQAALFVPVTAGELAEDEVSIGTFTLSKPQAKSSGDTAQPLLEYSADKRPAATSTQPAIGDRKTLDLFEDALTALDAGYSEDAQRLFERLIAQAPDSALAKEARGYLAELYQGAAARKAGVEREPATVTRRGDTEKQPPVMENPRFGESPMPAESESSEGTKVSAVIEEQFIAQAGDRVFFSAGSAELGSRARGVLQAQARFIKLRPDLAATIEGHADDGTISADEHARLSQARAEAVRQRLIEEGIESHRLAVSSWGRDKRVSECPETACAAQNRRVVTVLVSGRVRRTDGPANGIPGVPAVIARDQSLLTH